MRTREVWIHAVDLDNGATFTDIPAPVLERLLKDITGAWHTRGTDTGLVVKVTDTRPDVRRHRRRTPRPSSPAPWPPSSQWATGRGTQRRHRHRARRSSRQRRGARRAQVDLSPSSA